MKEQSGVELEFIPKNLIEPTIYVESLGIRTTEEKDVLILDFFKPMPRQTPDGKTHNAVAMVGSVALNKKLSKEIVKNIFEQFPDIKEEFYDGTTN